MAEPDRADFARDIFDRLREWDAAGFRTEAAKDAVLFGYLGRAMTTDEKLALVDYVHSRVHADAGAEEHRELPRDEEAMRDAILIEAATPGPWTVHAVDDAVCMNARTVARPGGTGELDDHENNVAVVLLQEPRYAEVGDGRWDANAEFIARARTRWPSAVARVAELQGRVDALRRENADLRAKLAAKPRA